MEKQKININEYADKILEKAISDDADEQSLLFITTFNAFKVQTQILDDLAQKIEEMDALVTKEYVKGRQNIVVNPAITEYNKTASARNNTVTTLIKIMSSGDASFKDANKDEFVQFLESK